MNDALDSLLERLAKGDMDAAGEAYSTFEPVLRVMVRRRLSPRLRAKFDSMDVVQSAWADVLKGIQDGGWRFTDREHLRAYLARVTYNHLVNYLSPPPTRNAARAAAWRRRSTGLPPSTQPRPSELAQADELWELLVGLCPAGPPQLLELKRHGYPACRDRQGQTGLHESSVRRILYDLARRLATVRGEMVSTRTSL